MSGGLSDHRCHDTRSLRIIPSEFPSPGGNMKAIPWLASIVGSYVGWWLGAFVGTFTAIMLSIVGAGVGLYFGAKWAKENLA
jgi:hypothetical protein